MRMRVEVAPDFPEEEIDVMGGGDVAIRLASFRADLDALIARARAGSMLRSGLHLVWWDCPTWANLHCSTGWPARSER